jgi:hypothetical protein
VGRIERAGRDRARAGSEIEHGPSGRRVPQRRERGLRVRGRGAREQARRVARIEGRPRDPALALVEDETALAALEVPQVRPAARPDGGEPRAVRTDRGAEERLPGVHLPHERSVARVVDPRAAGRGRLDGDDPRAVGRVQDLADLARDAGEIEERLAGLEVEDARDLDGRLLRIDLGRGQGQSPAVGAHGGAAHDARSGSLHDRSRRARERALEPAGVERVEQRRARQVVRALLDAGLPDLVVGGLDADRQGQGRILRDQGDAPPGEVAAQRDLERAVALLEQVQRERETARQRRDRADDRDREHRVPPRPAREAQPDARGPRADRLVLADAPQVLGELERSRVAPLAVGLERGLEDDLDVLGQRRVLRARVGQGPLEDLPAQLEPRRGLVRSRQRQRLVERRRERVHVRPPVDRRAAAGQLLGRHVRRRAEDVAGLRQRPQVGLLVPREPEVEQDRRPVPSDEDVPGLHVAVDDTRLVRRVERARHALEEVEHAPHLERGPGREGRVDGGRRPVAARGLVRARFGQDLRERVALDEAHRDVGRVAFDVRVEDAADAGVLEARDHLGLAAEAPAALVGREVEARREHLERDAARDPRVLRQEDGALAAATDLREDPVRADAARGIRRRARAVLRSARQRLGFGHRAEREVLARHRFLDARIASEVVRERVLAALLAIREVLVDEVEQVRAVGLFALGHRLGF